MLNKKYSLIMAILVIGTMLLAACEPETVVEPRTTVDPRRGPSSRIKTRCSDRRPYIFPTTVLPVDRGPRGQCSKSVFLHNMEDRTLTGHPVAGMQQSIYLHHMELDVTIHVTSEGLFNYLLPTETTRRKL